MTSTTYANSPVKSCQTCVHHEPRSGDSYFSRCNRWQHYCSTSVGHEGFCGASLRAWQQRPPKPPLRSLRQWIYDLLWK